MSINQQQTDFINKLSLHQSRRNQSIPTLSTLVGGAAATQSLWTKWTSADGRYTAVCTYESLLSLFEAWLYSTLTHCDLQTLARARAAQLANREVESLSAWIMGVGEYQKSRFWQRLSAQSPQAPWLRFLVQPHIRHAEKCREALRHGDGPEGIGALANNLATIEGFAVVSSIVSNNKAIPGILVRLPQSCDQLFFQRSVLPGLTQLVESVPLIPVGLLLSPSQHEQLLEKLPESRAKAVVKGGMVRIDTLKETELRQWLGDRELDQELLQPILRAVQQYGATDEILAAAISVAEATEIDGIDDDGKYRSYPEWLLFQFLEARPTTAGQFQVNARLDIPFGNRSMEVDFLADKAKVVVELDGYYHFQSSDSYRRDRRKDIALQQEGFWVLRFLSEDVVANLEEILATIDQVLSLRLDPASVPPET